MDKKIIYAITQNYWKFFLSISLMVIFISLFSTNVLATCYQESYGDTRTFGACGIFNVCYVVGDSHHTYKCEDARWYCCGWLPGGICASACDWAKSTAICDGSPCYPDGVCDGVWMRHAYCSGGTCIAAPSLCDQSCGADPACDQHTEGQSCGTNMICVGCNCISTTCTDSDDGNYPLIAGTCTDWADQCSEIGGFCDRALDCYGGYECFGSSLDCVSPTPCCCVPAGTVGGTVDQQDSCSGVTLTEYYCSADSCISTTKNCNDYDCTTGLASSCTGAGTSTLTRSGDDYICSDSNPDYCAISGSKTCESYTCGSSRSCDLQSCAGTNYMCYRSNAGSWKWDTSAEATETDCDDGYDNDCDENIDCYDDDCVGETGASGDICCQVDLDCKNAGVTCESHVPPYPNRYAQCAADYTCTECGPCETGPDCTDDLCCNREVDSSFDGQCPSSPKGTIVSYGGKSYLCDPPSGFSVTDSQTKSNPILEFFNFILSAIKNLF